MLQRQLEARDREEMDGKTELIEYLFSELERSDHIIGSVDRFADMAVGHPHLRIGVRAEHGWLLSPEPPFVEVMNPSKALIPLAPSVGTAVLPDGRWWLRRIDFGTDDGRYFTAVLGLHVEPAQELVSRFRRWLLVTGLLGVAASALLGWAVAKRGLAPLASVGRDAERVTAQHIAPFGRLEEAPGEVRALTEAINRMLDRLAASFKAMEEFSADIAHELRTPLHNLMLQTQVTLARPRTADEYKEALHSVLEELQQLQRMVSDMLFLARADRGMLNLALEPVDMRAEAEKVAEFFEAAADETGRAIAVLGNGIAWCDRMLARRALTNLLSNAIRYSVPGGQIEVRIEAAEEGACEVELFNPSTPMTDEQLQRLFARFSRGETTVQVLGEGSGLGLSIVSSIMALHRGGVSAKAVTGGVVFRLRFPGGRGETDSKVDAA